MENKSAAWVFPTVKSLVSLFYYLVLIALLGFTLISTLKLMGAQLKNVTFQSKNVSLGEEPPSYVSVPVAWGPADTKVLPSSGEPPIYLKPQKLTGQLQVPIQSTPGILTILLGLVGLLTATWTFFLLRRIFTTVKTKSPFEPENARRITTMGFLFLGQTLVEVLLKLALWYLTKPFFQRIRMDYQDYLSVDVSLDGPWLLGLILLALAQVYQRGIVFQHENELTV